MRTGRYAGFPRFSRSTTVQNFVSKHLEQVAVDLKMRLLLSTPGRPQGRGKIERFFRTVNEMFLCNLEGYMRRGRRTPTLTLEQLDEQFHAFLLEVYQRTPEAELSPSAKWERVGSCPGSRHRWSSSICC